MTFEEFNKACTCSSDCTCPACSGITFDETTKLWRKEHRPQPEAQDVWKALLALRDACDLRTELGADVLFDVLLEACKRVNHPHYQQIVWEEGDEALDVTIVLGEKIIEVIEEWGPVQSFFSPKKTGLVAWEREIAQQMRLRS